MTTAPDALTVVVEALDGFAAALESGRAEAVLAAEELLAVAASGLRTADLSALADHPGARIRIDEVRLRIARCRAMGQASTDLSTLLAPPTYGPKGIEPLRPPSVATITSRI